MSTLHHKAQGFRACLIGIMTSRNTRSARFAFLLITFAALAGCQPWSTGHQDIEQLRQSATKGDTSAQYNLGSMYAKGEGIPQDDREAAKWLRLAAEQGHAQAQADLGLKYYHGRGVPQGHSQAVAWTRKAANQGDVSAQGRLGLIFYDGALGVPQNYGEAIKWFRMAAHQGDTQAQRSLGEMYAKGQGVPKDFIKAHAWLNLAAAQGRKFNTGPALAREELEKRMSAAQILQAQELAAELFERIESSQSQ